MQICEQFAIHQRENTSGSPSSASINAVEHVLGGASREPPDNSNSSVSSAPRAAVGSWWLLEFFNVSVGSLRSCRSADATLNCRYLWGRKSVFLWVHVRASSVGCVCLPACILWVYAPQVCYCHDLPPQYKLDQVSVWNIPVSCDRKTAQAVFCEEERLSVLTST